MHPNQEGETIFRHRYGPARTPFQRLCDTHVLSPDRQDALQRLYDQTNRRRLREEIHRSLECLFRLPGASPTTSENVLETLLVSRSHQKGAAASVTFSFDRTITAQ